jgi:hypothetical protein
VMEILTMFQISSRNDDNDNDKSDTVDTMKDP